MLRLHAQRQRLFLAKPIRRSKPSEQIEAQVPSKRLLDDLAVPFACARRAHLDRSHDLCIHG
jgi:hypothetical protein